MKNRKYGDGKSAHGIGEKKRNEVKVAQSCLTLRPHGLCSPRNFPGQNTGVGSPSLLEGFFPTQGLSLCLPHCRRILYQLSHKGSPGEKKGMHKFTKKTSPQTVDTGRVLPCHLCLILCVTILGKLHTTRVYKILKIFGMSNIIAKSLTAQENRQSRTSHKYHPLLLHMLHFSEHAALLWLLD